MPDPTNADEPDDLPSATLDVAAYPDPDDLAVEIVRRLAIYRSLVITDDGLNAFPNFLIYAWRGVFVVRGQRDQPIGTFASIEAAIGRGRTVPRDDRAGDDDADALA